MDGVDCSILFVVIDGTIGFSWIDGGGLDDVVLAPLVVGLTLRLEQLSPVSSSTPFLTKVFSSEIEFVSSSSLTLVDDDDGAPLPVSISFSVVVSSVFDGGASGILNEFDFVVAHGIHSLTVEDINIYFDPKTTDVNNIPTVNDDLKSSIMIRNNAPYRNSNNPFHTEEMNVLNWMLDNMDNPYYFMRFSVLERIVHVFHMKEFWYDAAQQYSKLKTNPPNSRICNCITSVRNNYITEILELFAFNLREPEMLFNGSVKYVISSSNYKNLNLSNFLDHGKVVPVINSKENWDIWKAISLDKTVQHDHDLAVYLYCMLNKKD